MNLQGKAWGHTSLVFKKNNVEIHLIYAKKGGFCSKHAHQHKFNKFIVQRGTLKVTIWKDYGTEILEDVTILTEGMTCMVSPGDYHKFEALEDTYAMEIYWVELDGNDIKRVNHGGLNEKKTAQCDAIEACDTGPSRSYRILSDGIHLQSRNSSMSAV